MRLRMATGVFIVTLVSAMNKCFGYLHSMDPCANSCSDAAQSQECMCRTYTFAFIVISPWVFLDAGTGEVHGPTVDLARKVCETAGKLCIFAGVEEWDCWDGKFSNVLNGRWYDVCYNVLESPGSISKYEFSKYPVAKTSNFGIFARQGSNITEDMIRNPHDLHLAMETGGEQFEVEILDAYLNAGYFIKRKNIIRLEGDLNSIANQMVAGLECGQSGGNSIDLVIMCLDLIPGNLTLVAELDFSFGFAYMTVRKDEQCLLRWYDEAYEKFVCGDEYPTFCQQLPGSPADDFNYCQIPDDICN